MDGGAWWGAVHGVAKSQTELSDFPFTFHFHELEKEMATHSSVLAWRIPGTGEPGGLPSMGSHRVVHDWSDLAAATMPSALSVSGLQKLQPHNSHTGFRAQRQDPTAESSHCCCCITSLSFLAVAVAALLCVCLLLHQVLQAWTDVCAGSFKAHTGVVCGMQWITPVVPSCFGLSF